MSVERRIESALRQAVHYRNYRRARERALSKLSHLYPDTYKQLLGIEKAIDEQEGKNWIDISGNTRMVASTSTSHGEFTSTQTDSKENYDGGEA
jgi:hypothetical protein